MSPQKQPQESSSRAVLVAALVGIVVLGIAAVLLSRGGDDDAGTAKGISQYQPVTVTGSPLPTFGGQTASDPAIGTAVPDLRGKAFGGNEVEIAKDGHAKVVIFVAHWCPHCQNEVPVVTKWLDEGNKPDGVDVYAVSTAATSDRPNWPPSAWLEREKWPVPTIADDEQSQAAAAYGLNAFPYFVFVKADGTVAARTTGEVPVDEFTQLVNALAG